MPSNTPRPSKPRRPSHESTVLVLQGGGALGAYQAGVYEGMHEAGIAPNWITGVSIGAINAALIAGNRPEDRIPRLREFWDRVSSGIPLAVPAPFDLLRLAFNRWSASASAAFGVPGFFAPRVPPTMFNPPGTPGALSVYDSSPLRDTLNELVDFKLINARDVRLSVGAVDVRSGNSVYFDNNDPDLSIGVEHVMASGALPPGLPPIQVTGVPYWDGGLVSNTPLWYVLDDNRQLNALIVQVDLFSARGTMPRNLEEVLERAKDIQYSSKTRFNTSRAKEEEALRQALRHVIAKLPARLRNDVDVKLLIERTRRRRISIVHLINRRSEFSTDSKDYEFSRATILALWAAGLTDVRRTIANPHWGDACDAEQGMRTYDLLQ
ncbi:MAG: patatin-like phospholipase family protein [Betaproteobacteria bacterium]|nr:MAG: patatin-like phospholipase family protein [Betaproteobacteria bacterium]